MQHGKHILWCSVQMFRSALFGMMRGAFVFLRKSRVAKKTWPHILAHVESCFATSTHMQANVYLLAIYVVETQLSELSIQTCTNSHTIEFCLWVLRLWFLISFAQQKSLYVCALHVSEWCTMPTRWLSPVETNRKCKQRQSLLEEHFDKKILPQLGTLEAGQTSCLLVF